MFFQAEKHISRCSLFLGERIFPTARSQAAYQRRIFAHQRAIIFYQRAAIFYQRTSEHGFSIYPQSETCTPYPPAVMGEISNEFAPSLCQNAANVTGRNLLLYDSQSFSGQGFIAERQSPPSFLHAHRSTLPTAYK